MKMKLGFMGPWLNQKPLREIVAEFDDRIFNLSVSGAFALHVPDSVEMHSAQCFRQNNDFGRGVHNPDELGIIVNVSQIFKKEGRDIQGLADGLQQLVCQVIRESEIEGVSVYTEIYASETGGSNFIVDSGPWVS